MPEIMFGLPLHPLVVHAAVVLVPASAALLLMSALLPRFRKWAGLLTPGTAVVALILVPLSTSSGEELEEQVGDSSLLDKHAELGEMLLPWMIAVTVLAIGLYLIDWRSKKATGGSTPSRTLSLVLAGLSVVAFAGTTVQVALIGHSGAKAVWSDSDTSG